jgi:hypothetical protein
MGRLWREEAMITVIAFLIVAIGYIRHESIKEAARHNAALQDILDVPKTPIIEPDRIPNPGGWRDHPPQLTGQHEEIEEYEFE